ncbi:MAG: hypothetical protein AAF542_22580 [Pseudomonadota bacterium]
MRRIITLGIGFMLTGLASVSAMAGQDCILEGEIKKAEASDGTHAVYIDFHTAKRFSVESQCRFRQNDIQFNGIAGSQITKLAPGATVKYRYTQEQHAEPTWQLLQVSL